MQARELSVNLEQLLRQYLSQFNNKVGGRKPSLKTLSTSDEERVKQTNHYEKLEKLYHEIYKLNEDVAAKLVQKYPHLLRFWEQQIKDPSSVNNGDN